MFKFTILIFLFTSSLCFSQWEYKGAVAAGYQFDVQAGSNSTIHLLSSQYYQFDYNGNIILTEDEGDEHMEQMDFSPAIFIDDDNQVHAAVRIGGSWDIGHFIVYKKRDVQGNWTMSMVSSAVKRNYVVSVVKADDDNLYFANSYNSSSGVGTTVQFYKHNGTESTFLGQFSSLNYLRSDADFRMGTNGSNLYMATGYPWPTGYTFYFNAAFSDDLDDDLESSVITHSAGSGRKGFPDLHVHNDGTVDFIYGSQYMLYYNRYLSNGSKIHSSDKLIMSGLGDWHLDVGLGAIGVSSDKQYIMIVGIKSNGSDSNLMGTLQYSCSIDGGNTFTTPQNLSVTNAIVGEGRLRPRITCINKKFFLFYNTTTSDSVYLAAIDFDPSSVENKDNNYIKNNDKLSVYPNPFNPTVSIDYFTTKNNNNTNVIIYDQNGSIIKNVFTGYLNKGTHKFVWNGKNLNNKNVSSGIYILAVKTKNSIKTKKLFLTR